MVATDLERFCVMIVEDEIPILDVVREILDMEEMDSIGVARPDLALPAAQKAQPSLFLIDIMLSGMSGIDVAQRLREEGFAGTPMIAMSASTTMLRAAQESKVFDRCLAKPFDFDTLIHAIEELMACGPDNS